MPWWIVSERGILEYSSWDHHLLYFPSRCAPTLACPAPPTQIRDTTFRDTLSVALKIHVIENLSYNDQDILIRDIFIKDILIRGTLIRDMLIGNTLIRNALIRDTSSRHTGMHITRISTKTTLFYCQFKLAPPPPPPRWQRRSLSPPSSAGILEQSMGGKEPSRIDSGAPQKIKNTVS